jgi:16S rRNA (uracil1498-N3)-methyltransferase
MPKPAGAGDAVDIRGSDAHHIKDVLRLPVGGRIGLFDERGYSYEARIEAASPGVVRVRILGVPQPAANESSIDITLAQAYLKDKNMDRLVRQVTELGASCWIPVFSDRSIPKPDPRRLASRLQRWQKISREAVKQCRRGRSLVFEPAVSFAEMLDCSHGYDLNVIFWEKHPRGFGMDGGSVGDRPIRRILVLLGPEGGFSKGEVAAAKAVGFVTAGLGPRILRAETATVAALTLIQTRFGDMGENPES